MTLFSVVMWGTRLRVPGREDFDQPAEDEHAGEASGGTLNQSFIYIRHQPGHCSINGCTVALGILCGFNLSVGK